MPLRTCIGCGGKKPKSNLITILKSPKSEPCTYFEIYENGVKKNGRSAYICKSLECFKNAVKHRKLEKSFKCKISKEIYEKLEKIINETTKSSLDIQNKSPKKEIKNISESKQLRNFLGITKKSGNMVLGMDLVKQSVLEGNTKLILVTDDISPNSFEEIKNFAFLNSVYIFKLSLCKNDIFELFGKYSAIIGITNENFIKKITEIIASDNIENKSKILDSEECNI